MLTSGLAADQPHNHNSENVPVEPSTLAFSMYTNTSSAAVSTGWQSIEWVIRSSKSTLDDDQFVAARLKAAGITLIVQLPPDPENG
jgi:hypothetical protein